MNVSGAVEIPFETIQRASLAQAVRLLREWFPAGRIRGKEFVIGNLRGDPGDSLSINIATGLWSDFATGDSGHDLIDLRAAMTGRRPSEAALELASILGIETERKTNGHAHTLGDDWHPLVPPPSGAPKPAESLFAGYDTTYEYCGPDDEVLLYVRRRDAAATKRKEFHPLTFGVLNGTKGWHAKHPRAPLPLYGLNRLSTMPDAPVLLCEGEKAADAAQRHFPDHACVSWMGGTSRALDADLEPLKRRRVVIWPDNDAVGLSAAGRLHKRLPGSTLLRVDDMPAGGDAADLNIDDPEAWLQAHLLPIPFPLPVEKFDDIAAQLDARDFVQGLLLEQSSIVVYGESNSGKTFWTTDLALHVAHGAPWAGRRVEQGAVVYCVLEGGIGFRNRIAAWRVRHGPAAGAVKFAAIPATINLLDPDADTQALIDTIKAVAASLGCPVKLVVIDTLSRALAGGNENAPEDMGALVLNMDRIRAETGAAVLFVHHSGKDQARGARGHSLLRAAIDTEIEVMADEQTGARTATVVKQRELPKGDVFGFSLAVEKLGRNRRGEEVTSCAVVHDADVTEPIKPRGRRNEVAEIGIRALQIALSQKGALLPETADYPTRTYAVPVDAWREEFYQLKAGSPDNNRQAFGRAETALLAANRITARNGLVWIVSKRQGSVTE